MNFIRSEDVEVGDLYIHVGRHAENKQLYLSWNNFSFFFKKSEEEKSILVIFGNDLFYEIHSLAEQADIRLGFLYKDPLSDKP